MIYVVLSYSFIKRSRRTDPILHASVPRRRRWRHVPCIDTYPQHVNLFFATIMIAGQHM